MIMPDDKKRIATIIASRKNAKGESSGAAPMNVESVRDEAGGAPDGRHIAAQELLMAIHEKSAEKLMNALANFQDIHASRIIEDSKE